MARGTSGSASPRRNWWRGVALVLASAALSFTAGFLTPTSRIDGPIILISIDTLRADHLPAYGYGGVATPAIDALVRDSILFERAYSHVPQTLPAHTSIFSGTLPFEHGVRDNVGFSVRERDRLLPQWLHDGGFETGGVVSADVLRRESGIGHGFDFYDSRMPPVSGDLSSDRVRRDGSQSLEIAEQWIAGRTSRRFFLFLHLYEPHAPYAPPARFAGYQPYDAEIAYADEIVGRLLTFLRARGLYDSATIILLSDHGEGLGDHGEQEHGLFLYEETLRVPLMIKAPAARSRGRRVSQPVQHIDLVPTILDFIGMPAPPGLHGRSLRPLVYGDDRDRAEASIYSESLYGRYHFGWSELTALTEKRYRFIHAPRDELYDLDRDPGERRSLTGEHPQTAAAMRAALTTISADAPITLPAPVPDDQRARLESLGYVTTQATVSPGAPGAALPDPKDKIAVLGTYRRVLGLVQEQKLPAAIDLLQKLLETDRSMPDLWFQLGALLRQRGRTGEAIDAFRQVVQLNPRSTSGALALSSALLAAQRLDDARRAAMLALSSPESHEPRDVAATHELLARIALAREDAAVARSEAAAAALADPSLPLPQYVDGRITYSAGDYSRALTFFEDALRASAGRTRQVAELHLYAGDTLAHVNRFEEAEKEFLDEIRYFPGNVWAYASVANLYHSEHREDEADRALDAMLRASPSPDAYSLAVRLLITFGNRRRAADIRAESRRLFANSSAH